MVTWLLGCMCVALLVLLIIACKKIEHEHTEALTAAQRHSGCHEGWKAATEALTARHDADLIRRMAQVYENPITQKVDLQVLAREQYNSSGPSLPAIWMLAQA